MTDRQQTSVMPYEFETEPVQWDTCSARYTFSHQDVHYGRFPMDEIAGEQLSRLMARNLAAIMSVKTIKKADGSLIYEASLMLSRNPENHESSHRRRASEDMNLINSLGQSIRGTHGIFPPNAVRERDAYRKAIRDVMTKVEAVEDEFHQLINGVT